jgi:hypothetical protein
MLEYLRAKVVDCGLTLRWITDQLDDLSSRSSHSALIVRLRERTAVAERLHRQLDTIVAIQVPRLLVRALPIIHDIELVSFLLTRYYIPGIRKETVQEQQLCRVLLATAQRAGLNWIDDLVMRLDGDLACVSHVVESPVIFAPPHLFRLPWELAGVYHELGHNVFRRHPDMATRLIGVVDHYYRGLRAASGPLGHDAQMQRDRAIDRAINYWSAERLNELFCDIFATFVCGPAHYVSCIDLAVRLDRDPFRVKHHDPHPPSGARVFACERTLDEEQRKQSLVHVTQGNWRQAEATYPVNADYGLFCGADLINRLVEAAVDEIIARIPTARRYNAPQFTDDELLRPPPVEDDLERLVNAAVQVLMLHPTRFTAWSQQFFRA